MDRKETLASTHRILQPESPGWMERKCQCALGAFGSDSRKPLAPLFHICAALLSLSVTNTLSGFLIRILIPQYHYPYLVPLTFAQVLLTLLAMLTLHTLGLVALLPYSLRLGEHLLVPSVCESVQAVLALWAELNASSGTYPLTMHLLPLACVGWSHALRLWPRPSIHTTFLLTAVTLTSLTTTGFREFLRAQSLVCLYAPLSLLLHSLSLTWLAKVDESEKGRTQRQASPLDIYFCLTVNKSLVLGFLCLLHPDSPCMLTEGSWHSLLFLAYLLAVLLLGSLQRLLLDMTALHRSPLAAALLHTAPSLAQPFSRLL